MLATLMWQLAFCLRQFMSRRSMPSGGWVPQDKPQERTDYLHWVWLLKKLTDFRKSILRLPNRYSLCNRKYITRQSMYQPFIASIAVKQNWGNSCDGFCYSYEQLIVKLVYTLLTLPGGLAIIRRMHEQCKPCRHFFSFPPPTMFGWVQG